MDILRALQHQVRTFSRHRDRSNVDGQQCKCQQQANPQVHIDTIFVSGLLNVCVKTELFGMLCLALYQGITLVGP
jgi:hypothetical protein